MGDKITKEVMKEKITMEMIRKKKKNEREKREH